MLSAVGDVGVVDLFVLVVGVVVVAVNFAFQVLG